MILIAIELALLSWLERRHPLRPSVEPKLTRMARNVAAGGLAAAVSLPLQLLLLAPLVVALEVHQFGLLPALELDPWLETALAIVLLDATLWHWHWLNHRVPFLWRFHLVHHTDRDMDASTGLRFHGGELVLSVFYRALQLAALGAPAHAVLIWSTLLTTSVLFHHANLRLPWSLERALMWVIVTPRYHDLHHSTDVHERDANYASILTIWDRLHRTTRTPVEANDTTIGVPGYQAAADAALVRLQRLPFEPPRGA